MCAQTSRKCDINFKGHKVTTEDIPKLSYYSGTIVPYMSDSPALLSHFRPEGLSVDNPLRISMESITEYMLAYVREIAKKDIDEARNISKSLYLPYVRKIEGKSSYIVERRVLADIVRERAAKLGIEARKGIKDLIEEVH